jgi:outer membrane autotransporter protein
MRKTSLSIAVGLALAQFIPAPVTAADTTEDFIEVNTSISLDDTTKAQTKTFNFDKNAIYKHTGRIELNGQGGKKDLTINVKNGSGDFIVRDRSEPIQLYNSDIHLTFNSNLVMEGMERDGIMYASGNVPRELNIKGDFIYRNSYATAIKADTGYTRSNLFVINIDGKADLRNVSIGGNIKHSVSGHLLDIAATDFTAKKGIFIDNIDVNASDNTPSVIFVPNGSVITEEDINITNINFNAYGNLFTSIYAENSTIKAKAINIKNIKNNYNNSIYGYVNNVAANTVSDSLTICDILNLKTGDTVALYMRADSSLRYGDTNFNVGTVTIDNVVANDGIAEGMSVGGAARDNGKLNAQAGSVSINGVHGTRGAVGAEISDGASFTSVNNFAVTDVKATAGDAIGLMLGAKTTVGDTLSVQNVTGTTSAVGVQFDGTQAFSSKVVQVKDIKASDGSAIGLLAHQANIGNLKDVYINVNPDDAETYKGSFASSATTEKAQIKTLAIQAMENGAVSLDQGKHAIYGHLQADKQTFNSTSAVDAKAGSIAISGNATIYGDIYAVDGGTIDLNLKGSDSVLTGQADAWLELADSKTIEHTAALQNISNAPLNPTTSGKIAISLTDGASWFALGQNSVTSLDNQGTVDMTTSPGATVFARNLTGNGAFNMTLDPSGSTGNMLFVAGALAADSRNTINVKLNSTVRATASLDDLVGVRFATTGGAVDSYNGTEFKAQMLDEGFQNVTLVVSKEAYDKTKTAENSKYNGAAAGAGDYKPGNDYVDHIFGDEGTNWYIAGQLEESTDPTLSDAGLTILATARSNYWTAVEMDRLNKRLGDARYANGDDGVWLRARYESNETNSGLGDFESDAVTYQLGFDHAFKQKDGRWIVGGAVDYKDVNVDFNTTAGEGNTDRFGFKAYGTWLGNNGAYVDLNTIWGVLSNSFDIVNGSGHRITANYDNHIIGASAETGHRFMLTNGFFAEPQLQLQYLRVTGADYSTSQGTHMIHDAFNSVISRVGFRGGMEFGESRSQTVYAKADWMREWSGKQKITAFDVTTQRTGYDASIDNKGSWYDVGFGAQAKIVDDSFGFVDVEYRFGNSLNKSWVVNAGIRYAF